MKTLILAVTLLLALVTAGCAGGIAESAPPIGYDTTSSPAQRRALAQERAYDVRMDATHRPPVSDLVAWPSAQG